MTLGMATQRQAHWCAIFFCGLRATSGHEEDRETREEERVQQKMVELRRRKNEPGRYLKMLRNQPKVSMTGVSRADALEEIRNKKVFYRVIKICR